MNFRMMFPKRRCDRLSWRDNHKSMFPAYGWRMTYRKKISACVAEVLLSIFSQQLFLLVMYQKNKIKIKNAKAMGQKCCKAVPYVLSTYHTLYSRQRTLTTLNYV